MMKFASFVGCWAAGRAMASSLAVVLVAGAALPPADAQAAGELRTQEVRLAVDDPPTSVTGRIRGDEGVDYLVRASAGQTLTVNFKPSNPMAYFAAQAAALATAQTEVAAPEPFTQGLKLQGIGFQVSSPNTGPGNTVRIVPSGLQIDNAPVEMAVAGQVVGAEVADLNVDGSPELYIYLRGPAPDRRGSLLAVSANKRKSLGLVTLPDLGTHRGADKGYRGHDEMAVVESRFMRRFPLYGKDGDPSRPTGRTRQLQYKLAQGEASWVLKLDRMTEY